MSSRARAGDRESIPGLVTVCIPSYNHAPYLAQAVESALGQTYDSFEIVITDDGSSDGSLELARSYAARYPRKVRVVTHPGGERRGISATANLGMTHARGEFWTGLPSDDAFLPHKLEREVDALRAAPEASFVHGRAQWMTQKGERLPEFFGSDLSLHHDPLVSLIVRNSIAAMTVMARRLAVPRHAEDLAYSDWQVWVEMVAGGRAHFIDEPLALYRSHDRNMSVGVSRRQDLTHCLAVIDWLRERAESAESRLNEPRILALLELRRSEYEYQLGRTPQAKEGIRTAFARHPDLRHDVRFLAAWLKLVRDWTVLDDDSVERFGRWALAPLSEAGGSRLGNKLRRYLWAVETRVRQRKERTSYAKRLTTTLILKGEFGSVSGLLRGVSRRLLRSG